MSGAEANTAVLAAGSNTHKLTATAAAQEVSSALCADKLKLGAHVHPQHARMKRSALVVVAGALVVAACVVAAVSVLSAHRSASRSPSAAGVDSAPSVNARLWSNFGAPPTPPYKFAVQLVPPRKVQYTRGTCWDFALVALVEHQYRLQGVSRGYLKPDEYLSFSEQAFGYEVLQFCQNNQQLCLFSGDQVAFNSTEGGENNLLYEFRHQFRNALLPWAVCPYVKEPGPTSESCDNAAAALVHNPLHVEVTGYHYYLDIPSIKQALWQSGRSMDFGIAIHYSYHYLPCDHPLLAANTSSGIYAGRCPASPADACPDTACPQNFRSKCCVQVVEDAWSFPGEFRSHGELVLEAGHTMLLTGYNDEYTTEAGLTGGFIMRNSWMDSAFTSLSPVPDGVTPPTRTRGSHSMSYFLNEITATDERVMCPNSFDPRNWYTVYDADNAVDPNTFLSANASLQPLHLRCVSLDGECQRSSSVVYYAVGFNPADDGLVTGTFVEIDTATGASRTLTLAPRILDTFAWAFLPWENETRFNDPDYCGYYFWPYDLMRRENAKFPNFYVIDYELDFAPQSYLANARWFPHAQYDYSWLAHSMHTQKRAPVFDDVYPNDLIFAPADARKIALKSVQHKSQQRRRSNKLKRQPVL